VNLDDWIAPIPVIASGASGTRKRTLVQPVSQCMLSTQRRHFEPISSPRLRTLVRMGQSVKVQRDRTADSRLLWVIVSPCTGRTTRPTSGKHPPYRSFWGAQHVFTLR
jgi:hypothetical protein